MVLLYGAPAGQYLIWAALKGSIKLF